LVEKIELKIVKVLKMKHTYNNYNIRPEAKEFPMMCVISFVYVCNAHCTNCTYNNSEIRKSYKDAIFMSEEIFKKIADECGEYNAIIRISGGGEPMLHPQAVELIKYAKQKGAKIGLITNGSLFTYELLAELIENQIDAIEFSVDACDEETYKKVRPGLDWQRTLHNVKNAIKIRNEEKSSTRIIVSAINQIGVDIKSVEKFWEPIADKVQIRKYLTWGYNKDFSADDTPYLSPEERIPCPWLFERLNIDSRGDVTLCGEDIAFKYKFDNIMKHSIKEIWIGKEFTYFREKHLNRCGNEIEICSKCPDWKYRSWLYNYWKVLKDAEAKRK